jgi:hypothetical protein
MEFVSSMNGASAQWRALSATIVVMDPSASRRFNRPLKKAAA